MSLARRFGDHADIVVETVDHRILQPRGTRSRARHGFDQRIRSSLLQISIGSHFPRCRTSRAGRPDIDARTMGVVILGRVRMDGDEQIRVAGLGKALAQGHEYVVPTSQRDVVFVRRQEQALQVYARSWSSSGVDRQYDSQPIPVSP
jgi:hypothetical protein